MEVLRQEKAAAEAAAQRLEMQANAAAKALDASRAETAALGIRLAAQERLKGELKGEKVNTLTHFRPAALLSSAC